MHASNLLHLGLWAFTGVVASQLDSQEAVVAGPSMQQYLNPWFEDNAILRDIMAALDAGEVAVIHDALRLEIAEEVYREIDEIEDDEWDLHEAYLDGGFAYKHHNFRDVRKLGTHLQSVFEFLDADETKTLLGNLSGRDCSGEWVGSASWYRPGDFSLPHSDRTGQRTVAFVWHLSKDWRSDWGGYFYWTQDRLRRAYRPPSFNTLLIFSVDMVSDHFVTQVSPHAESKRLAVSGWWQASSLPETLEDAEKLIFESTTVTTEDQSNAIDEIIDRTFTEAVALSDDTQRLQRETRTQRLLDRMKTLVW